MEHHILIGEAKLIKNEEGIFRIKVLPLIHAIKQQQNHKSFPYPILKQFINQTEMLKNLFLSEETGWLSGSEKCFEIYDYELTAIRKEKKAVLKTHKLSNPKEILEMFNWFEYWFKWSLRHCKRPAIYNY